jgi:hypothetical protein
MPSYRIAWPATLGRSLPDTALHPLLDVELQRRFGTTPNQYGVDEVELVVTKSAADGRAALQAAQGPIRLAVAAAAVVLGTTCRLGPPPDVRGDDGSGLSHVFAGGGATICAAPIAPAGLANAAAATTSWKGLSPDERDRIELALRWVARASQRSDPLDMLLEAWIAFETVVKRGKRSGGKNAGLLKAFAIPELRRILPCASTSGLQHLLREIYDVERCEVIHAARAELEDAQRSRAALALSRIVLEDALGLPIDIESNGAGFIAAAAAAHALGCTLRCTSSSA